MSKDGTIPGGPLAAEVAWGDAYHRSLVALLREVRTSRFNSDAQLAEKLGMYPASLSRILAGERAIGPKDLARIGVGLELEPEQILVEAVGALRRAEAEQ